MLDIERDYYFCRFCHEGFSPIDIEIELLGEHKVTKDMADRITYAGQVAMSFEKSAEILKKFTDVSVSESLIRTITEEIGQKVFEQNLKQAKESFEKPEMAAPEVLNKDKKEGVLYILTDGSHVNTINIDGKGSSWREMKLGLVFWDRDSINRKDGKAIITKKEYVTYFGEVGEFKKLLFDAAARAGYGKIREVVVIGDGAHWIWNMCEEVFPNAVQILDYFHMVENVSTFAKYLYPNDEIKIKGWTKEVVKKIEKYEIDEVLNELPDLKDITLPVGVPNLKKYLENNRNRINYPLYKSKEFYVGSGAIESGNKLVIQQRMKQSGMRWSISGGQYIASLRAKYTSNQWEKVRSVIGL